MIQELRRQHSHTITWEPSHGTRLALTLSLDNLPHFGQFRFFHTIRGILQAPLRVSAWRTRASEGHRTCCPFSRGGLHAAPFVQTVMHEGEHSSTEWQ